ncbi:helix-turn-helix domain-containing protein [Synechococcus sp. PCC 6312]|uniref:helix-turn-helix domain-containing protein n=1 Tax=Synechococcus sp. (strain ATCC 27167 / PCC 6312) TaxID=195253 RepID=UPI00029F4BB0|nr:helix-turn-helix domain-containing protein [Synechococcus sp. PCC 6312]AFY61739.1 hypothetical protein Syn6312_2645 [Synechococcus sp. PCC 6312]
MDELNQFINACLDSRETKRALAVKMTLEGFTHQQIMNILRVSSGFVTKWKQAFLLSGVNGLKLGYKGKAAYFTEVEKQQVNGDKPEQEWPIHYIKLAPYAPKQNLIEAVWLQVKNFLRNEWHLLKTFKITKWLFEQFLSHFVLHSSHLSMYGTLS